MDGHAQSSQGGGRGGYGKDTVRPVTIRQAIRAAHPHPDAEFKIDGEVATQITFVGQIRAVATLTTNITYKVDDGTDIIEVKQWIDRDAEDQMDMEAKKTKMEENT